MRKDRVASFSRHGRASGQQVEVQRTGVVPTTSPAAERALDLQQASENDRRCQPGPNQRDRVDIRRAQSDWPRARAVQPGKSFRAQTGARQAKRHERRSGRERAEARGPKIGPDGDQDRIGLRNLQALRPGVRTGWRATPRNRYRRQPGLCSTA